MRLRGEFRKSDEFETLLRLDWEYLKNSVIKEFGPPNSTLEYPRTPYFSGEDVEITDVWEKPGVKVQIGVRVIEERYYAVALISDESDATAK